MKKELRTLVIIFVTFGLLFACTLLLDLEFIQRQWSRQLLVYVLMLLVAFVGAMSVLVNHGIRKIDNK